MRNYTTNGRITGIRTVDILDIFTIASAEIVGGGIHENNVAIQFAGHIPNSLEFRVEIYTSGNLIMKCSSFVIIMMISLLFLLL